MKLYLWTIAICSALIFSLSAIFAVPIYGITVWYCLFATVGSVALVFGVDAIIALLVRAMPVSYFDPYKKCFKQLKFEQGFYLKIGIRGWKDKIPEMGKLLVKFSKKKVEDSDNPKYLYKFLTELGYAEVMHIISAFVGFVIIFALPLKFAWFFGVPVASVNFVLQILPFFIQRYNRPRLLLVYQRAKKRSVAAE